MKYVATVDGCEFVVEINHDGRVLINDSEVEVDFTGIAETKTYSLIVDGHSYELVIDEEGGLYEVQTPDGTHVVTVEDELMHRLMRFQTAERAPLGEFVMRSPMPGVVVEVPVAENEEVLQDQVIVVIESMKMQNELKSRIGGVVRSLRVQVGDRVDLHQVLAIVTPQA